MAGGQRSTRLSMLALIQEGILEPGERLLTFDYMVSKIGFPVIMLVFVQLLAMHT